MVTIDHLITPVLTLQISDAVFRFVIKTGSKKEMTQYYTVGTVVIFSGAALVCVGVVALSGVFDIQYPGLVATYIMSTNLFAYYQKVSRALGKGKYYVLNIHMFHLNTFEDQFFLFWSVSVCHILEDGCSRTLFGKYRIDNNLCCDVTYDFQISSLFVI